jgi:catechol-2,3-dioxygenase
MSISYDKCGLTVLKPKYLAHVVLKTPTPETFKKMVDFYKIFLNAKASYENDILSFLTFDEEHHRVAIAIFPGTRPRIPQAAGLAHVAFAFDSLRDLAIAYRQRKAHGIVPFWCINHGPTTSMYYRDPDGNEIETQVDNFDTIEEIDKFMTGKEFGENPIGTEFDPEVLIQRLEDGEDDRSIKRRVETGARMEIPV